MEGNPELIVSSVSPSNMLDALHHRLCGCGSASVDHLVYAFIAGLSSLHLHSRFVCNPAKWVLYLPLKIIFTIKGLIEILVCVGEGGASAP